MPFAKSWQEKSCSSQAETWQVKNTLINDFNWQVKCDVFVVSMASLTIDYSLKISLLDYVEGFLPISIALFKSTASIPTWDTSVSPSPRAIIGHCPYIMALAITDSKNSVAFKCS